MGHVDPYMVNFQLDQGPSAVFFRERIWRQDNNGQLQSEQDEPHDTSHSYPILSVMDDVNSKLSHHWNAGVLDFMERESYSINQ